MTRLERLGGDLRETSLLIVVFAFLEPMLQHRLPPWGDRVLVVGVAVLMWVSGMLIEDSAKEKAR